MTFEIWSFTDSHGGTWHLESVNGPDARYDGFLRHVEDERQTQTATMAHRFEAESRKDAEAFYRAWIDEKGPNGLPHIVTDGKIKCGHSGNFPKALTYGEVYDVFAKDLEKRQYRVKGSNGRTRWYPSYCFVPLNFPTPRITSFEIDESEVNITLDDGTKRWLNLISLSHLSSILQSNVFYQDRASVFVSDLKEADIESILEELHNTGKLLSATRSFEPCED